MSQSPEQEIKTMETKPAQQLSAHEPPYSAFPESKKRFYLGIVTAAGLFGPLCGAVHLPSLNL